MNSALLKHPIEIYRLETVHTEYGTIEPQYNFYRNTRAHIIFNSETAVTSNGEIYYPTTRTFIIRSYNNPLETDRIKWNNQWWRILSINRNDYYNNIEIMCETVNT